MIRTRAADLADTTCIEEKGDQNQRTDQHGAARQKAQKLTHNAIHATSCKG